MVSPAEATCLDVGDFARPTHRAISKTRMIAAGKVFRYMLRPAERYEYAVAGYVCQIGGWTAQDGHGEKKGVRMAVELSVSRYCGQAAAGM